MPIPFFEIVEYVAGVRGYSRKDIVSDYRASNVARARHEIWWMARRLTKLSLPQMGAMSNRDHTSVMNGIRRVEAVRASDGGYRAELEQMADLLEGRERARIVRATALLDQHDALAVARRIALENHPALHASGAELRALAFAFIQATETPHNGEAA